MKYGLFEINTEMKQDDDKERFILLLKGVFMTEKYCQWIMITVFDCCYINLTSDKGYQNEL